MVWVGTLVLAGTSALVHSLVLVDTLVLVRISAWGHIWGLVGIWVEDDEFWACILLPSFPLLLVHKRQYSGRDKGKRKV